MAAVARTGRRAAPTPARKPAVKVVTTKPKGSSDRYPFDLCGVQYHARMPKDFVWLMLAAAMKAGSSGQQKADAMMYFLDACLDASDREAIRTRMATPAEEDPVRGLELLRVIDRLSEVWRPFIEAEFETASLRADEV